MRFRIEDVALTDDLRYFLSSPHWLDALTPPLSNHIARLEVAIKELLASSTEVSGKNVVDDAVEPEVSPVTPPAAAVPPSAVAPAMPPPPPPLPRESIAQKAPEPVAPVFAAREREPAARKSLTPWILLAVGAVVLFVVAIGVIFFVLRQPKASKQQASTAPTPTETAKTQPTPAPPRLGQPR